MCLVYLIDIKKDKMKLKISHIILLIMISFNVSAQEFKFIEPETYLCNKIDRPINVDGKLDEEEWLLAKWTNLFIDIEGDEKAKPYLDTKAKMLYDNEYFYFAFKIDEPHIWANLTKRDTIIFFDNDIEIFIDADGSTHDYLELELNALNTIWDLYLAKPYREGGPILNDWDYKGIETAVYIDGTLNDPRDEDKAWYVEVALPWSSIVATKRPHTIPINGETMRVNFSRVQWETEVVDGKYVKKKNTETGNNLPENNWVWSPIGAIDMHRPEMWGVVVFNDVDTNFEIKHSNSISQEELRQVVSHIYKKQKKYNYRNGRYADNLEELRINNFLIRKYNLRMSVLNYSFEIVGTDPNSRVSWMSNTEGKLKKL